MADIGNQLEGVGDGLDRFLDALDDASYKLGSNAALQATQARAAKKMQAQDIRFKKRLDKIETDHAKQIKTMQPVYKKLWTGIKDEVKQRSLLSKGMMDMSKATKNFATQMAKGGMSKGFSMIKGAAKAGIVGALILGVKVLIDGLLKIDKSMATLVKATGRARAGLEGMMNEVVKTETAMGTLGVNLMVATKEAANLSQQFGMLDKVTTDVIQTSLGLQMAYGVSAESAGQLLVTMDRIGKSTEEFVSNLAVKAVKAGVNVSLVMRDMSSHAQQYAMYNERAQQAMENMAIQSARTGGSLDDIKNISDAYSSVEGIAENVGRVGTFFGKEAAAALGDPRNAYMMAEQDMWTDLQKNHDKAFKSEFKIQTATNGLISVSNDLRREERKIIEAATGESILVLQNRALENAYLEKQGPLTEEIAKNLFDEALNAEQRLESNRMIMDIQKSMVSKKQLTKFRTLQELTDPNIKENAKALRLIQAEVKARREEAREAANMNEIIKQSQTIVERFKNIFSGIWGEFTTQMSIAFGMDDRGEDSAMGKVESFAEKIRGLLQLDTLAADIEGKGFVGALEDRLAPLFKYVAKAFGSALGAGIEWFQENYTFDFAERGFVKTDKGVLNDYKALQEELAGVNEQQNKYNAAIEAHEGAGRQTMIAAIKATEVEEERLKILKQYDEKLATLNKAKEASLARQLDATEAIAAVDMDQIRDAAIGHGSDLEAAQADAPGKFVTNDMGIDIARAGVDLVGQGFADAGMDREGNLLIEGGVGAKGLSGYRGPALVGEAGGEVVASRSALRTGIGVSGKAASELAGIGVPGFYRGGAIEQTYATQNLAGAAGAESFGKAIAVGFNAEQQKQQLPLVQFHRHEYNRRLNEAAAGAKDEREKDGIAWSNNIKKFFNTYPALIDRTMQKAFNVQSGAGKEMYTGVFTAMQNWSNGESPKKALTLGVQAGLSASLKKGGTLDNFFKNQNNILSTSLSSGLAMFAATGSLKKSGRAMAGAGVNALMNKYLGGDAMSMAREYMGGGGSVGGYMQQQEFGARAQGFGTAAKGKYVNSPTLMMVGEGGASEVVIPTDRIRKGLPINAGVAKELGSIGVPGFRDGGKTGLQRSWFDDFRLGQGQQRLDLGQDYARNWAQRSGQRAEGMGGLKGVGKASAAAGLMTGLSTWQQTGDWKQGATAGVGGAAGMGISAGLMAMGIPPPFNTMIGGMAGQMIGKGLNKVFGVTGGQKKGRNRSLKLLESHVKSDGLFDFGQPSGLRKQMKRAIGGKENAPTEGNYNKLIEKVGGSQVLKPLWGAGFEPNMVVALGQGQLKGKKAFDAYTGMNTALYGSAGGDKYAQAMEVGPQLAEGGIVTRPTRALIGERGPETVIPLHQQEQRDKELIDEMKKQNKLMMEMIKTQKETGKTEIRLDGRKISESVGENFYDIGSGM